MSSTSRIPGVPYAPVVIAMSDKSLSPSWWRVWSNGWCEQGLLLVNDTANFGFAKTVNLIIPFADTNYSIEDCAYYNELAGTYDGHGYVRRVSGTMTTSGFSYFCGDAYTSYWLTIVGWLSDEAFEAIKQGKTWNGSTWIDPS